jgi:hypothetical protein
MIDIECRHDHTHTGTFYEVLFESMRGGLRGSKIWSENVDSVTSKSYTKGYEGFQVWV